VASPQARLQGSLTPCTGPWSSDGGVLARPRLDGAEQHKEEEERKWVPQNVEICIRSKIVGWICRCFRPATYYGEYPE
jgi:hypothetical protein